MGRKPGGVPNAGISIGPIRGLRKIELTVIDLNDHSTGRISV